MSADSDRDLLAAVAAGDRRALRALYDRHAPWLTLRLLVTLTLGVEAVLSQLAAMAVPAVVVTLAVAFDVAGSAWLWTAVLCYGLMALVWGSRDELRAG